TYGYTHHLANGVDGIQTYPDHSDNRSLHHESLELWEKWIFFVMTVPSVQDFIIEMNHLETDELEALSFEASDDLTDQSSLQTVQLDYYRRLLDVIPRSFFFVFKNLLNSLSIIFFEWSNNGETHIIDLNEVATNAANWI